MADVQVRFTTACIEVVVYGEVLHQARWPGEACRVADWARYQLKRGATVREIRAALQGAPMEQEGEGVLLAEAQACHGVLRGTLDELRRALDSGALDEDLGALLEAERLDRDRDAFRRAIEARKQALSGRAA